MGSETHQHERPHSGTRTPAMRVLVIENSRLYRTFLARVFNDLGLEPTLTESLAEAREHLEQHVFDLVCMNKYLKGTSAAEFVQEIRGTSPELPILMLTSDRTRGSRASALSYGVTEVIFKATPPEMGEQIWSFVNHHLKPRPKEGRVLYCEDSSTESAVVVRLLHDMDLAVDHFTTAEEAIERLEWQDYDLVISDIMLGGERDGLAVLNYVRNLPEERSQIPVLTITGFDDPKRRLRLLKAGTNDYVVKPIIKEELSVRVSNLLTSKKLLDKVLEQQAQLYEQAITDPLTGCYNRRGFREFIDQYLATMRRRDEEVSLLLVDLDRFKSINDAHGHVLGDRVLSALGGLLNSTCRQGDVVSRIGGEEFVIFLANCGKDGAMSSARRVRTRIEELEPEGLKVTGSIGVTTIAGHSKVHIEEALKAADKAVYRAKRAGRNRVSFRKLDE